jgi:hypothetical protein
MLIRRKTIGRDLPWIIGAAMVVAAAATAFAMEWMQTGRLPGGGSRTGFACGLAGGLIILFECALWPRRRVRSWRLGSAQTWLRAHVWLGLACLPLVLLHTRLFLVGGWFNLAFVAVFVLVILSGIWGLVLQQFLPSLLLERVPAETIREQIDHVSRLACDELTRLVGLCCERGVERGQSPRADDEEVDADEEPFAVVSGFRSMTGIQGRMVEAVTVHAVMPGTAVLAGRFEQVVRPYLLGGARSGSPLAQRGHREAFFAGLRGASPPEAGPLIERIMQACDHRRQFDLQATLHDWLHGWLLVHVPLSAVLGVMLAVHVPVALWYW